MRQGLAAVSHQALPRLRTGLRLQRCTPSRTPTSPAPSTTYVVPFNHAPKSAPGEQIIFRSEYDHPSPGDFQLVYTGVGGTFDSAAGGTAKTIAGLKSGNVYFFIDAKWNGTDPVTVKLEIKRTADGTAVHTEDWIFGKKGTAPTTITQQEAETERPLGSTYGYKLGPDLSADGKDDYVGQTILEKFGQPTCNITMADLKPEWLTAHPAITTDADITTFFFDGSGGNSSFSVRPGDMIFDMHGGGMPDKADFEAALKTMKEVHVDLPQTYEALPNVTLGTYTIRRIMKTDGSKMLRKMRTP
jgi:hypothetical protein